MAVPFLRPGIAARRPRAKLLKSSKKPHQREKVPVNDVPSYNSIHGSAISGTAAAITIMAAITTMIEYAGQS